MCRYNVSGKNDPYAISYNVEFLPNVHKRLDPLASLKAKSAIRRKYHVLDGAEAPIRDSRRKGAPRTEPSHSQSQFIASHES